MPGEQRQVLRDYALALEGYGLTAKGPVQLGAPFTIIRYQVYDAKGRCDLCRCEHKAGKQATIRDEATRALYSSGTSCLSETLGYNEAALERAVKGRRTVAARISQITGTVFENEREMIEALISAFVGLDPHHPEVLRCLRNLSEMQQHVPLTDQAQERLGQLLDFHALLTEALRRPQQYQDRMQALALDPCHRKQAPVNWDLYRDPAALTVARAEVLKGVMKKARSKRQVPKLQDPAFLPWHFESEAAYLEAARRHYVGQADRGEVRPEILQASYDFEHFNYELVGDEKMPHPHRL
ncbi:hypothetical protein, partial [Deinococcus sp.]|uniref:hypothetical protein n=1 Tax=Deinococcus sp. TaxID=47478 RepID=UPI0025E8D9B1